MFDSKKDRAELSPINKLHSRTKRFMRRFNATRIYKKNEMEADHVTAWSKGGSSTLDNCDLLCKTHNKSLMMLSDMFFLSVCDWSGPV